MTSSKSSTLKTLWHSDSISLFLPSAHDARKSKSDVITRLSSPPPIRSLILSRNHQINSNKKKITIEADWTRPLFVAAVEERVESVSVLSEVLHDVILVSLQRKIQFFNLHNRFEKLQISDTHTWCVRCCQLYDSLNVAEVNAQTVIFVSSEHLCDVTA